MAEIHVTLENESPIIEVDIIGSGPMGPTGPQGIQGPQGETGETGAAGQDGVSPGVTVASITGGHNVTITDAGHPTGQTFNVMDGEKGDPGQDGVSPGVTIASITGGHSVTITDAGHPTGQTFNVMDGEDGEVRKSDLYAMLPTDTASGAVASFSDGADDVPVKSLAVNIEPVQSGTGDPAPDNVRPITGHSGVTVWDDAYYGGLINWNQKAPALNTTNWKKTSSATHVTFTAADGVATVAIAGNKTSNTHIYPSTTPDVAGHVVYLRMDAKCDNAKSNQRATVYFFQNASTAQSAISSAVSEDWTTYEAVATITVTAQQIRFYVSTGSNSDFSYYIKNPQIIDLTQMFGAGNEPTTLDAFHALFPVSGYACNAGTETTVGAVRNDPGWSVPVTFPTPPGTVYGGTLDVTTGVLTVTMANIASYAGESINEPWLSSMDKYVSGSTPTTGAQVVYALATPVTYQLTAEEVSTLLGQNNIWADTGDVALEYRADIRLYIQKLTGSAEEDMIADANIANGKYFMVGNSLYLSTASIPAGEQIVPGTNCTATNLAAVLNALNS